MSCPPLVPGKPGVAGPVVTVIMDGVGVGSGDEADAVARAHTPNLDTWRSTALYRALAAHGTSVGMPSDADMGNSEVGHNAIGAGRVFDQGAKLVAGALADGTLFEADVWRAMMQHLHRSGGALHLIGLLSDGNVHSHIEHVEALVARADAENLPALRIHALLDGRDVPKTSALDYIDRLEAHLAKYPSRDYCIASGGGRMITTMDRYESDWSIVERGWHAHVHGEGRRFESARLAVETLRAETPGIIDQDLAPFVIGDHDSPAGAMHDGDAAVTFNFRGDRMLQLVSAFEDELLEAFDRGQRPQIFFCGMTLYDGDTQRPRRFLVDPPRIRCTVGELLAQAGIGQLACSETQKFGHVTYFWNGNRSGYFDQRREKYVEVPSMPPPFDRNPQMKAKEITDAILEGLSTTGYQTARLNYANGDMVGHTGNFEATVAAVEAVDVELARLAQFVLERRGALVVTADHGNADDMAERHKKTGEIKRDAAGRMVARTSHSLNPVPFYVVLSAEDRARYRLTDIESAGLGHIASTLAVLLGFEAPEGFQPSLITGA